MPSGLEIAQVYSQRKDKEKMKKRISEETYNINKQKAPKSKIESRVHYTPEPALGKSTVQLGFGWVFIWFLLPRF